MTNNIYQNTEDERYFSRLYRHLDRQTDDIEKKIKELERNNINNEVQSYLDYILSDMLYLSNVPLVNYLNIQSDAYINYAESLPPLNADNVKFAALTKQQKYIDGHPTLVIKKGLNPISFETNGLLSSQYAALYDIYNGPYQDIVIENINKLDPSNKIFKIKDKTFHINLPVNNEIKKNIMSDLFKLILIDLSELQISDELTTIIHIIYNNIWTDAYTFSSFHIDESIESHDLKDFIATPDELPNKRYVGSALKMMQAFYAVNRAYSIFDEKRNSTTKLEEFDLDPKFHKILKYIIGSYSNLNPTYQNRSINMKLTSLKLSSMGLSQEDINTAIKMYNDFVIKLNIILESPTSEDSITLIENEFSLLSITHRDGNISTVLAFHGIPLRFPHNKTIELMNVVTEHIKSNLSKSSIESILVYPELNFAKLKQATTYSKWNENTLVMYIKKDCLYPVYLTKHGFLVKNPNDLDYEFKFESDAKNFNELKEKLTDFIKNNELILA